MAMLITVLVITYVTCTFGNDQWNTFKETFNKTYKTECEENFRRSVWTKNKQYIDQHNRAAGKGVYTFWLKVNRFADMINDEIDIKMTGKRFKGLNRIESNFNKDPIELETDLSTDDSKLPKAVDWRKNGAVTEMKDQGDCGSCYAFAATGALEGQYFKRYEKLVSLSEQNILDCTCSNNYHNYGCEGGCIEGAFVYVMENGIATENAYQYTAKNKVANVGPIAVEINAHPRSFKFYFRGVYNDASCSSDIRDHAMLVVGYNSTKTNGQQYWIVKNSWGEDWGEEGYMRIIKNEQNLCGIMSAGSYPILEGKADLKKEQLM